MSGFPRGRKALMVWLMAGLLSGWPALAQDAREQPAPDSETRSGSPTTGDGGREQSGGEQQPSAPPDADFTPSEEISEDLSVPFPVDI